MKQTLLILSMLALLLTRCTTDSTTGPSEDLLVVRAYVYANEPVWDIQITKTLELGSTDSVAQPVNDAQVLLSKDDNIYQLTAGAGDSGYYHYDGDDLTINADDKISIEVTFGDYKATGNTNVPQPPSGISLDKDSLLVPTFTGGPPGGGFDRTSMELNVTWENDPNALFYVVVQNVEENPVEIESGFKGRGNFNRRFVFPPTNRNEYRVNAMSLTHYGKHIVRVYRVNQEYADLYGSRQQDSRELNEPLTNIKGGLGIFSAFNSVSAHFWVAQQN